MLQTRKQLAIISYTIYRLSFVFEHLLRFFLFIKETVVYMHVMLLPTANNHVAVGSKQIASTLFLLSVNHATRFTVAANSPLV